MASIEEQKEAYTKYIEGHRENVRLAYNAMITRCKSILLDEKIDLSQLETNVKNHDLSKYTEEEFGPYRKKFFPADGEEVDKTEFYRAVYHHYTCNKHHWNHWIGQSKEMDPIYVVEMTLDWIAMGMQFGNTALEYYEKNKNNITLSKKAEDLFYRLINKYYNLI